MHKAQMFEGGNRRDARQVEGYPKIKPSRAFSGSLGSFPMQAWGEGDVLSAHEFLAASEPQQSWAGIAGEPKQSSYG